MLGSSSDKVVSPKYDCEKESVNCCTAKAVFFPFISYFI